MEEELIGYVFGIILGLGIIIAITEYWGRTKHIGRFWSILLLLGNLIVGLIAIAVSPSTDKPVTKGNNGHIAFGIISLIVSAIMVIIGITFMVDGQGYNREKFEAGRGYFFMGIGLIFLGIYLIQLFYGKIENKNPRISRTNNNADNWENIPNGGYSQATPVNNNQHAQTNDGGFYNGGHNARISTQPQQQNKPQTGKGEFNGDLYN